MKLFIDCEIVRPHLRGNTAVIIVGNRAVTAKEGRALLAEFAHSFGVVHQPMYFSVDGWQILGKAAAEPEPEPEPEPAAPESVPAKTKKGGK